MATGTTETHEMADPLISAIIPTYNGATRGFLAEAIESVLAQTYRNFELIIVDDGSTDATKGLCERYLVDKRVRVLSQRNRGLGAARNLGIENSSGEFICLLDDDDLWKPEKLETQIAFIHDKQLADGRMGMVFHAVDEIDEKGKVVGLRVAEVGGDSRDQLFLGALLICPSAVMIPRSLFASVGYFDEGSPMGVEDYDMWLRITKHHRLFADPTVLGAYRVYGSSQMSSDRRGQEIGVMRALLRAFRASPQIPQAPVYGQWYRAFSMWHFREGDYGECRRCYAIARHYGPVGWRLRVAFWAAHLPQATAWFRRQFPEIERQLRHARTSG